MSARWPAELSRRLWVYDATRAKARIGLRPAGSELPTPKQEFRDPSEEASSDEPPRAEGQKDSFEIESY